MGANNEWKKWGDIDPYYGVLSHDDYRRENWNEDAYRRFFESGEHHVAHVFEVLKDVFGFTSKPCVAVDYGCGTGRLAIPLARRSARVIGFDVAAGMLREACVNTSRAGIDNIDYRLVTDDDSSVRSCKPVDLIHSHLVFQHIPPTRGQQILRALLGSLVPGGFGALHFTVGSRRSRFQQMGSFAHRYIPLAHAALNAIRGRTGEPRMRMEQYATANLIQIFNEFGIKAQFCEHTDHDGYIGLIFYFQKP